MELISKPWTRHGDMECIHGQSYGTHSFQLFIYVLFQSAGEQQTVIQ